MPLPEQVAQVRAFLVPDSGTTLRSGAAARHVGPLAQIAGNFRSRLQMLSDLTLDPPNSTQDHAGPPLREEDYLILSTIHSAKGCEWDVVYVIYAADGKFLRHGHRFG